MGSEAAALGPSAILDMAQEWKGMGDSMVKSLVDCFSSIESREKHLRLAGESLAKRSRDLEERERELEELKSLLERRGDQLSSREETLDEQLRLVREHIEGLESSQCEVEGLRRKERKKLKEIENKERELDVVRGLLQRQLDEAGKKSNAFDAFQNGKLEELALKEELLCKEKREFVGKLEQLASKEKLLCKNKREFVEEVKLANEKLKEKQRLGYGLINRLESALDMLGGMKVIMDGKLKEIELRETMAHESLTSRLNEADSIRESLEKRFKELEDIQKELNFSQDKTRKLVSKEQMLDSIGTKEKLNEQQKLGRHMVENEPEELTRELGLKQGNMLSCKKEPNYEKLDYRERNMSSARESHIKENIALSKKDPPQAEACRPREVKSDRKLQHTVFLEQQESKQPMLIATPDVHLTSKTDKSADLRHELQKDRKALELLINDHQKDVEMMEGEIYKILARSSDPANLVLDTVQGHSGKFDIECKMRRATILLLEQLTKMSPKIQNCVTVAAVKLAFEWKSKLSANVEDPMEALGFLHFVAAFQLSSRFDKNELFNFMKLVGRHKQTPGLCHTLGLTWKIPGYIQHLINQKEYLLASTYTCEYQFMNLNFKQAAILNYYVAYSKRSANTRARNEGNTSEAQEKAIDSEIDDLRAAIAHIMKYGLESDYFPNALTARIQQLEVNRANLRSTSASDIQKHGNNKNPNKWKARRKHHQFAPSEPATFPARLSYPFKRRKHNSTGHQQQFGVPAG